jgi:hypothetical protein
MKCFGSESTFISVLCTYGYSFTIFIPIVIACAAPFDLAQWILLAYAVFSATSFILVNYWKELSKYMQKKRYFLIILVLACQVGLFFLLKMYFFERFTQEISGKTTNATDNTTPSNTTANSTNSTLMY